MDVVSLPLLDEPSMLAAAERQGQLTKPTGALGRLEELAVWLAGTQACSPPRDPERVRVVVLAGDTGAAEAGVSAYPPEVTAQMVAGFGAGTAAVNVLARAAGATVRVEDICVATDTAPEVSRYKVRRSSGRIDVEDAMTMTETEAAYAAGCAIADEEADAGTDLLVVGDMGIANTTVAAVVCAAVTRCEPVAVVGRGTGIDDQGWIRKVTVVRDALTRVRLAEAADDPARLLSVAGGPDHAAMVGLLVQAAVRRTPVLLDGVVSCVAALVADRIAPGIASWQVAATRSPEPAQALALARLQHEPLLDLGLRLGEGTGALLAVPLLRAAAAALREMATFAEAGVSGRTEQP